jgi:hypothetical protein
MFGADGVSLSGIPRLLPVLIDAEPPDRACRKKSILLSSSIRVSHLQTSSHQQLWPNFQDPYTLFVVAPQLRLVETEATQEMDTSFRNHPHDQPQDFLLELALALPERTVPQKEQPTQLVADSRDLVGDLADAWLVVAQQITAESPRLGSGLRSLAATLRRRCSVEVMRLSLAQGRRLDG